MMHLCSWHNLFPSSLVLSPAYSTSSLLLSPACSLEWKLFFNDYLAWKMLKVRKMGSLHYQIDREPRNTQHLGCW